MTLEEAIKQLSFWETRFHDYNDPKMTRAVCLGIEALKIIKQLESDHPCCFEGILPGQTKD